MIKVLIVEDDPMVAALNKRYLEKVKGFTTIGVVRSAEEALAFLVNEEVNLVLLDIFMPGMDGLKLLAQIREMGKGIDVILVTAASDRQSIEKALRYGVVDYLIKPFEFERFNTALTSYREWIEFIKGKETLNQEQLDQIILNREQQTVSSALPKGLDRNTLKSVWISIVEMQGKWFSTEELSGRIGISRVSMRKYLDFLNQAGILKMDINYGSVGRPVYKYRCVDTEENIIKRYLL